MQRVVVVPEFVSDMVMCNVSMPSSDFLQHSRKLHGFFCPLFMYSRSPAPLNLHTEHVQLSLPDVCMCYANRETRKGTENTDVGENCKLRVSTCNRVTAAIRADA